MRLLHMKSVCAALVVLVLSVPGFAQNTGSTRSQAAPVAVATPVPKAEKMVAAPAASGTTHGGKTTMHRPLTVAVHLVGGAVLTGTLLDAVELPLRATFGHVQVPLSEVAGIKLAQEGSPVTTVVLHNGDVFTGATDLKLLYIKTEWGKAEVLGPNVSSILFTNGVRWTSDSGFSGSQWKLVAIEKPSPPPRATNPATVSTRGQRSYSSNTVRGRSTSRGTTRGTTRSR